MSDLLFVVFLCFGDFFVTGIDCRCPMDAGKGNIFSDGIRPDTFEGRLHMLEFAAHRIEIFCRISEIVLRRANLASSMINAMQPLPRWGQSSEITCIRRRLAVGRRRVRCRLRWRRHRRSGWRWRISRLRWRRRRRSGWRWIACRLRRRRHRRSGWRWLISRLASAASPAGWSGGGVSVVVCVGGVAGGLAGGGVPSSSESAASPVA